MSTECPAPLMVDGRLINWIDVERWMIYNEPLWNSAMHYSGRGGCSHEDCLKLLAYHATKENRELKAKEIERLKNASDLTSFFT